MAERDNVKLYREYGKYETQRQDSTESCDNPHYPTNTEGTGSCESVHATSEGERIQNYKSSSPSQGRLKCCGALCIGLFVSAVVFGFGVGFGIGFAVKSQKNKQTGENSDGSMAERQVMDPKYLRIQPSSDDMHCKIYTYKKTYSNNFQDCGIGATSYDSCNDGNGECVTCQQMKSGKCKCNGHAVTCCKIASSCNEENYCNTTSNGGQMECYKNVPTCVCPPDKTGERCEEYIEDAFDSKRAIGCHCYSSSYEFCVDIPYCTDYFNNTKPHCQLLVEGPRRRCYCENKELSDPQLKRCDTGSIQPLHQTNNSAVSVFKETSLPSILILLVMNDAEKTRLSLCRQKRRRMNCIPLNVVDIPQLPSSQGTPRRQFKRKYTPRKSQVPQSCRSPLYKAKRISNRTLFQPAITFENDWLQEMTNQIESRQTDDMICGNKYI